MTEIRSLGHNPQGFRYYLIADGSRRLMIEVDSVCPTSTRSIFRRDWCESQIIATLPDANGEFTTCSEARRYYPVHFAWEVNGGGIVYTVRIPGMPTLTLSEGSNPCYHVMKALLNAA